MKFNNTFIILAFISTTFAAPALTARDEASSVYSSLPASTSTVTFLQDTFRFKRDGGSPVISSLPASTSTVSPLQATFRMRRSDDNIPLPDTFRARDEVPEPALGQTFRARQEGSVVQPPLSDTFRERREVIKRQIDSDTPQPSSQPLLTNTFRRLNIDTEEPNLANTFKQRLA